MKPQIDYKSLLLICSCLDEILRQKDYAVENLDKAEKDISKDKAIISLDTLVELQEFLGEDIPKLTEMVRNYAKKMENKLREYKAQTQKINKDIPIEPQADIFADLAFDADYAAKIRRIKESKEPILVEESVNYMERHHILKYYYSNESIREGHVKRMEQNYYRYNKDNPSYDIFCFKNNDSIKVLTAVFEKENYEYSEGDEQPLFYNELSNCVVISETKDPKEIAEILKMVGEGTSEINKNRGR